MKIVAALMTLFSLGCSLIYAEGAYTPESILPEGVDSTISINPYTGESGYTRKGIVAATLNNVARLNALFTQEETSEQRKEIAEILTAVDGLISSLQAVGIFNLFEPTDWIGEGEQPGRVAVICLYFQRYPEKYTPPLQEQLKRVKSKISSLYLQNQIDALERTP